MNAFLAMGGYAAYVWPAYAVFFVVLAAELLSPALRRRRLLREMRDREIRRSARRQNEGLA